MDNETEQNEGLDGWITEVMSWLAKPFSQAPSQPHGKREENEEQNGAVELQSMSHPHVAVT